ncbi:MAG TPA: MFS transporter [Acidimicrobiia bacterium]|nr:MFS transporter [Acidimicrobiia bacterium]
MIDHTGAGPRSAWALIKSGPFSRLWRAGLISSTGDWVAILATLSLADDLAGGGGIVLALGSRIVPGLFFAAVGGVIADRLPRKYVMMTMEFGRATLVFSLAFVETIQALVLINLALEALTLVFQPAKEAMVPTLVRRSEIVRANSLSLSAAYGTFPLGAAIFTAIAPWSDNVTLWGLLPGTVVGLAFLLDSVTYVASALTIMTLPTQKRRPPARSKKSRRFNPMEPLRDLWEGIRFVAGHRRIRSVVLAMTVALAGGGIIVVLGKPFATGVLEAGTVGFPALLTAFGLGAGFGIVNVTIFGPRLVNKDVFFAIALIVAGVSLGAAAFVKTLFGGVGWIAVMGLGAGSAYVLGFAHLHEQTDDELRGRTFAALLSLMRIGLLTSMMIAIPLAELFDGVLPGVLSRGARVVLLVGGATILSSGLVTLWSVRRSLIALGHIGDRPAVGTAMEALRTYRKRVTGMDETNEHEVVGEDDGEPG